MNFKSLISGLRIRGIASAVSLSGIVLLSACIKGDDESVARKSYIMFINAYGGSGNGVDFMIDQTRLRTGTVASGSANDYNQIYSGNHQLSFVAAGESTASPVNQTDAALVPGYYYTCFLAGQSGSSEFLFVQDDLSAPDSSNKAKIRFINLSPGTGPVNLGIKDSTALFTAQEYMKISSFSMIDTALHTLVAYSPGTTPRELTALDFHAAAGRIYTFYIKGTLISPDTVSLAYKQHVF